MFLYAQVDGDGVVVSMSQLSGEVEHDLLIPLSDEEFARMGLGWRCVDGVWCEPEPVEGGGVAVGVEGFVNPQVKRIDELEAKIDMLVELVKEKL